MRAGRSPRGGGTGAGPGGGTGMRRSARASAPIPIRSSETGRGASPCSATPAAAKVVEPASSASGQPARKASQPYATQKAASAAAPASEPRAAVAAKGSPWSSAMKNATGPVVSGSPTSQPPMDCPQRRPASVAAPISAGVTTSLSVRLSMGGAAGVRGTPGSGAERFAQDLGGVLGLPARQVLDLLAAGDAGRHDLGLGGRRLHRGREPSVAQRHRDVVVLALEAEGARHAAAARIHLRHLVAGPPQGGHRGRGADHGLLVAVAVEQRLARVAVDEGQREAPRALAQQEFFQEKRGGRDAARLVGAHQLDGLVPQGEEAGGLEPDDGGPPGPPREKARP